MTIDQENEYSITEYSMRRGFFSCFFFFFFSTDCPVIPVDWLRALNPSYSKVSHALFLRRRRERIADPARRYPASFS